MSLGAHPDNIGNLDHFKAAFPEQTGQGARGIKTDVVGVFQFMTENQILKAEAKAKEDVFIANIGGFGNKNYFIFLIGVVTLAYTPSELSKVKNIHASSPSFTSLPRSLIMFPSSPISSLD